MNEEAKKIILRSQLYKIAEQLDEIAKAHRDVLTLNERELIINAALSVNNRIIEGSDIQITFYPKSEN